MTTLSHEIIGDGPEKVIVIGGWLGDHGVFEPTYPWLDRTQFTYCFADPRGYGGSHNILGEYTNAEASSDIIALADALGWDKFHFIGHSMMGKNAQYLAAHYGDRLKSVIGIVPVPACKIPMDEATLQLFSTAWEVPANRGIICMVTTGSRHTKIWEQHMIDESLRTTSPEAFRKYFYMWTAEDFAADVQGCKVPFLAITGEYDAGVPTDFVKGTILQWFPNAELQVIANAGHYPMHETPLQLVTICEAFLTRHS